MDIDWWSLSREARREAWNIVASILGAIWNALIGMLSSGDVAQIALAVVFIVSVILTSGWTLLKILRRLLGTGSLAI